MKASKLPGNQTGLGQAEVMRANLDNLRDITVFDEKVQPTPKGNVVLVSCCHCLNLVIGKKMTAKTL